MESTTTTPSLAGAFLGVAARVPARPAISTPTESHTFGELASHVHAAAAALRGSEIVLDSGARLLFVEGEWAHLLSELAEPPATVRVADDAHTREYLRWRE